MAALLEYFDDLSCYSIFVNRSVTLVGEKERKVLKEIVKQARYPVKSRVISQGVISVCLYNKYLNVYRNNQQIQTEDC